MNFEEAGLDDLPEDEIEAKRCEAEMARAVMGYLAQNPHAMDDQLGIAEWWVRSRQVQVDAGVLARVLEELVDAGLIQRVASASGPLYRLSP